jgi:hypothetical protein
MLILGCFNSGPPSRGLSNQPIFWDENEPGPSVTDEPRSVSFRLRVGRAELAGWKADAAAQGITTSAFVRRCVREVREVLRLTEREDRRADERFRRMGELTPGELRERRERGLSDWPEADEGDEEKSRERSG